MYFIVLKEKKKLHWGEIQDFIVSDCMSFTKLFEYISIVQNSVIKVSYPYPGARQPSIFPCFK